MKFTEDMATFPWPTVRETEGSWTSPEMAFIHGVRMPTAFVDPNLSADLEHFQTRKDDVFIGSYPKSGKYMILKSFKILEKHERYMV